MWVPWNMPDLSIPRPGSVPLTLETTSTPVTQSYVTLPSDGRPRHILNNSSSSSSEHPPLVPTGQRDDRQSDSGKGYKFYLLYLHILFEFVFLYFHRTSTTISQRLELPDNAHAENASLCQTLRLPRV